MRTRTALASLTAVLLLALTACSSNDEPSAGKPAATTAPEDEFLANAKAANFDSWKAAAPPDAELAAFPSKWCVELKAGHGAAYILGNDALYPIGQNWGTAKPDAQELLVLGITAYCPEYRDQITQELRDSGTY